MRSEVSAVRRRLLGTIGVAVFVAAFWADHSIRSQAQSGGGPVPDLSGIWDNRAHCTPNGKTCPFNVEEIPLNARAIAYREIFDEIIAPKYDCFPATSPGILPDPYYVQIEQMADRVLLRYEKDDVTRTAWINGRTPTTNDYSIQGYSLARYEGNTLVVETTHFTYDPTGLDDMAGLPSSARKRVVERYTRQGEMLKVDVTTEDPIFLAGPVVFSLQWSKTPPGTKMTKFDCDPAEAAHPLKYMPPRFPDGRARIPDFSAGPPDYKQGGAK